MLRSDQPITGAEPDIDTVTAIANALRAKFGDLALSVALTQQHDARDGSGATWDQIVDRLKD